MSSNTSSELTRLKRVILHDNIRIPNGVLDILKKDMSNILSGYFDIKENSVDVDVTIDESGVYNIAVFAKGKGAKNVKII